MIMDEDAEEAKVNRKVSFLGFGLCDVGDSG
jgi:hypothetical protein